MLLASFSFSVQRFGVQHSVGPKVAADLLNPGAEWREVKHPLFPRCCPVANPDTGWKPMLHYAVAWRLWVRGTRLRKHFDRSLDTPESIVA